MSSSRLSTLTDRVLDPNRDKNMAEEEDEEALFAELEAEIENDDNPILRERGLEALRKDVEAMKEMQQNSHGSYTEITDEKEVIRVSAREPRCVVHFYHFNFKRCEIMDKHLSALAMKYFRTRFFRVFVENVPWVVQRLGVKVLPCVICFIDGVSKDRLIGFEELGNNDSFTTALLETRLLSCGVISQSPTAKQIIYNVVSSEDNEDVFDL
ncbi:hypothetical protein AX15_007688 [Amanita polypyramis BW_CC]|nr:hypothetical protein AX15_007688 [Amanita polypyramis BW_CC]